MSIYSEETPIQGSTFVTASTARAYAKFRGAKGNYEEYTDSLWSYAAERNLNPLVLFAQWCVETDIGRSLRWKEGDPAGIGIFSNATASTLADNLTGQESAAIHVAEMASKVTGNLVTAVGGIDVGKIDPHLERVRTFIARPDWPDVSSLDDLRQPLGQGDYVWAEDQTYAAQIAGYMLTLQSLQTGEKMATFSTEVPGLPGGPLVTDYPIKLRIIPEGQKLNRPGVKAHTPRKSIQHGDGNPTATAAGDALWAFNGARGDDGNPTQTSFHSASDDLETWINVPLDEVAWQAADGSGPGNMNGFANELCENSKLWANPARARRAVHIAADFMGRCAARLRATVPEQHWDYNYRQAGCTAPCNTTSPRRHNCPDKLRHTSINGIPAWTIYVTEWAAARADELKRMHPTSDQYAIPTPISWQLGETGVVDVHGVKVTRIAYEVEVASEKGSQPLTEVGGKATGPRLVRGTKVVAAGNHINAADGKQILTLKDGSVVFAANYLPRLPKP